MASGFGINGNVSRCYNFWKNWSYCVAEHGYSRKCVPFRDDYIECLHHGKEVRCCVTSLLALACNHILTRCLL